MTRVEVVQPVIANLRQEIVDYIELAFYAAAEHVDDLDAIASGFFEDKHHRNKNAAYKTFDAELKLIKKFVATAANNIKHQQARIRLYSLEYQNGPNKGCLHGYFVEGVSDGTVGPSGVLHREQAVFSVTTLVWEITVFILKGSASLAKFLESSAYQFVGPVKIASADGFTKAFVAATRLPNYAFGEEHPFAHASISLLASTDESLSDTDSGLYGSLQHPWVTELGLTPGGYSFGYVGDGVTKNFKIVDPKSVSLRNWGRSTGDSASMTTGKE